LGEFHRATLEVLRQPMEDGHVTIARLHRTLTFPSRFTLAAALNPWRFLAIATMKQEWIRLRGSADHGREMLSTAVVLQNLEFSVYRAIR
jgi:predicted ATPase with chaperone activity